MNAMPRHARPHAGFTLVELLIVMSIISILAMIAYPSYMKTVGKSHRRAAQACLANYAQYMERYYTSYMRYDESNDATPVANTLPATDCAAAQNTGADYSYSLDPDTLTRSTYTLRAELKSGSAQASRDAACGTLTINQAGTRGAAGSTDAAEVAKCW